MTPGHTSLNKQPMGFYYTTNVKTEKKKNLGVHICASLDGFRQFWHSHLKAALNLLEHLCIFVTRHERNGQSLRSESTRTTHAVQL